MADNVPITPGSGVTIATDQVTDATLGTVQVQYVKIMDGTLDGTTKVGASANGLKVDPSGVTQPVSAAALPLPTGAATSAKQPAIGTAGAPSADVITVQGSGSGTGMPVTVVTLPLPTGAATAANQAAVTGSSAPGTAAINSQLGGVVYSASPPILSNGQQVAIQADIAGRQIVTLGGTVVGPVTPGTAGTNSALVGAQYNVANPAMTAGQQSALQLDATAALRVSGFVSTQSYGVPNPDNTVLVSAPSTNELLAQILIELRLTSILINEALMSHAPLNLAALRTDLTIPETDMSQIN